MGGESTKSPSILSLMNLGGYNVGRADDREEAESDENGNYGSTAGSAIRDRRSSYVSDEDGTEMSVVESSEIPKSRKSDHDDERIDIDDDPLLRDLRREFRAQTNPPTMSLLYGLINTSIVLPIVMSFGSIIYRDDFFRPYLSGLIQLTIVSGAVHQISFSAFSSLPFAVGSVQDAGEADGVFCQGILSALSREDDFRVLIFPSPPSSRPFDLRRLDLPQLDGEQLGRSIEKGRR